jgi:hypothetical protein
MSEADDHPTSAPNSSGALRTLFVIVGIMFAAVPLGFIAYGVAGILGGLLIVGALGLVQLPLYLLMSRLMKPHDTRH